MVGPAIVGLMIPLASVAHASEPLPSPAAVAAEVDRVIEAELQDRGVTPAPLADDPAYAVRLWLDVVGRLPPADVIDAATSGDFARDDAIARLLADGRFGRHWAALFRDAIFTRITDRRAQELRPTFTEWLGERWNAGDGWDAIVAAMITAEGDALQNGAAAFIAAYAADPEEIAAEAGRIFLGSQIACANCHDHPFDIWTRSDFHRFAAYFSGVRYRSGRADGRVLKTVYADEIDDLTALARTNPSALVRKYDSDKDGAVSEADIRGRRGSNAAILRRFLRWVDEVGDEDGRLAAEDLLRVPPSDAARSTYFMADLDDGRSRGEPIVPGLFIKRTGPAKPPSDSPAARASRRRELQRGRTDPELRADAAAGLTDPDGRWLDRAFVNRVWAELVGAGFVSPVDDLGPDRQTLAPDAFEILTEDFARSGRDIRRLFAVVLRTRAYRRAVDAGRADPELGHPFAATAPTRLRGETIANLVDDALGLSPSVRNDLAARFLYDPSLDRRSITGGVRQALTLMNDARLAWTLTARGSTPIARLLRASADDEDAVTRLYRHMLGRDPRPAERTVATSHMAASDDRRAAYTDLAWALLNHVEFVSRR